MTKFCTTLILVLGFCGLASAQQVKKVEFGVDLGYNTGYVQDGNSGQQTDAVSGFNAGVSADTYFSDRWSLKVKVIYDQKGWGNGYLTDFDGNEIDHADFKLNY